MNEIGYKQKLIVLTFGLGLLFILVFFRVIEPTITKIYSIYFFENLGSTNLLKEELKLKEIELRNFKNSLNLGKGETEIQFYFMDMVSSIESDVFLNRVLSTHNFGVDNYRITNQSFEIKGDFKSTVKLINRLENTQPSIYISSIQLESKKNQRTNYYELFTILYIQNVKGI